MVLRLNETWFDEFRVSSFDDCIPAALDFFSFLRLLRASLDSLTGTPYPYALAVTCDEIGLLSVPDPILMAELRNFCDTYGLAIVELFVRSLIMSVMTCLFEGALVPIGVFWSSSRCDAMSGRVFSGKSTCRSPADALPVLGILGRLALTLARVRSLLCINVLLILGVCEVGTDFLGVRMSMIGGRVADERCEDK